MTDTDFIKAMQQVLPQIKPPAELLLGNADIEINQHEAIWGICAQETENGNG